MTKIGKKERIIDLKTIWPTEPKFSDWLVTEAGMALIEEDFKNPNRRPKKRKPPW